MSSPDNREGSAQHPLNPHTATAASPPKRRHLMDQPTECRLQNPRGLRVIALVLGQIVHDRQATLADLISQILLQIFPATGHAFNQLGFHVAASCVDAHGHLQRTNKTLCG
jgi:hypothetical protein